MKDENDNKRIEIEISDYIIKSVAKTFLPEIQDFYKNNNSSSIKEMDDENSKVKPAA
ncbi:MAG: hypothetical protein IJ170_00060 [Ruminococcus sp.]|nr:hypothetical protein [Ruminococcus sp.]